MPRTPERQRRPIPVDERTDLDPEASAFDRMLLGLMIASSEEVAPGVLATVHDTGAWVSLRAVVAGPERVPGAVGAWLDTLPRDRRVIAFAVTSRRLAGMLERRGFECVVRWDPRLHVWDEGAMVREAV